MFNSGLPNSNAPMLLPSPPEALAMDAKSKGRAALVGRQAEAFAFVNHRAARLW
jgi:hypothetical protein